jgi:hypothetical protein
LCGAKTSWIDAPVGGKKTVKRKKTETIEEAEGEEKPGS